MTLDELRTVGNVETSDTPKEAPDSAPIRIAVDLDDPDYVPDEDSEEMLKLLDEVSDMLALLKGLELRKLTGPDLYREFMRLDHKITLFMTTYQISNGGLE